MDDCRVLEGTIPVALDGAWYFSSKEIHCGHCLTITAKKRDGTEDTLYYHEAVCAAIVKPGKPVVVLPLIPEFVRREDGKEKQDCERNAAKRWIKTHKERYSGLKLTIVEVLVTMRLMAAFLPMLVASSMPPAIAAGTALPSMPKTSVFGTAFISRNCRALNVTGQFLGVF